jgi:hypothetical protein
MRVHVEDPETMSPPGLLAAGLIARRLPARTRLHGEVVLDVAGSVVTLRFNGDEVEITRAPARAPVAWVSGSYAALSALAAGHPWEAVRLGVRARGRRRTLLTLAAQLRAEWQR